METKIQFTTCTLKLNDQITFLHISDYDKTIHKNNIFCKCCDSPMIGKKGTIKKHHFSHKNKQECDSWLQYKTEWHIFWQNLFNIEKQEVIIVKDDIRHIADIVSNGKVIEVQHSNISLENVQARELFYGNMIWLLDGNNCTYELCDMVDYHDNKITYTFVKIKRAWIQFVSKEAYVNVGDMIYKIIKHINDGYFILQRIQGNDFLKIIGTDINLPKGSIEWMKKQNIDKIDIIKYKEIDQNIMRKWDNKHFYIISKAVIDNINDSVKKICVKECDICDLEHILERRNIKELDRMKLEQDIINKQMQLKKRDDELNKLELMKKNKYEIDSIKKEYDIVDGYWNVKILNYKTFIKNELLNHDDIEDIKSNIYDIVVKQLQEQTNIMVNIHNHEMIKQIKCTIDKKNEILNSILYNLRIDQEKNEQNIIANIIVDKIFRFELPSN
jgi:competence CoiA-like predicted nuclease